MLRAQYHVRGPVPQDVIAAVELDRPSLKDGEVLIEVLAAPINPSDVLTLTGQYGTLPPLPAFAGGEGVGKVVEHGPSVSAPAVGQTVLLPVGIGSWSTHVVAKAAGLVEVPNDADPQQLSMITVNPPTAALMLSQFVSLSPGDWVMQNAANSAVGAYLIQLAKLRGLRTVNVVRRAALVAPLTAMGADVVVVEGPDLAGEVKQATGGAKIKLGIDAVGGEATASLGAALAHEGTLVNYGMMSGKPCTLSAGVIIFKDVTVRGFWLAKWFRTASKAEQAELYGELTRAVVRGTLKAPVQQTYSVKDIKLAVAAAAASERDGKILVVP
jgi:mitochondrial enoyl-[acyl-carrier protein] reductase / trans-2-enoyl-CoA reductase